MAYSGTMYVCLNEDVPHAGHQWTNPVGDRVICPGVTAGEIIKRLQDALQQAEETAHDLYLAFHSTQAERDAAIERGTAAYREGEVGWEQARLWAELDEIAEGDAKAQRALAEERRIAFRNIGNLLDGDVINKANWSDQVNRVHDIIDLMLAPAEAQKEGD